MTRPIACLLPIAMLVGCATGRVGDYRYPHDFENRHLPKIYLLDQSYDQALTIRAGGELVWSGMIGDSGISPNRKAVGVPRSCHGRCTIRISGGIYSRQFTIDWGNRKALVLHFLPDGLSVSQRQEPVIFF